MREINNKNSAIASVLFIILLTFLTLFVMSDDITFWNIIKRLPTAFTIYSLMFLIFIKWLWKCWFFKGWLVLIPDLSGKWTGKLNTTFVDPETGDKKKSKKIEAIIKQDLFSISFALTTKEMTSNSYIAAFDIDKKQNRNKICYTYTSRPNPHYRGISPIHDGTALLNIIGSPPDKIEGEYWTTRKTTGIIELKKVLKEHTPKT